MIEIKKKENCCGCTACASLCPKNAISMKEDEEGFIYPSVNRDRCIDCLLCEKVCPIINKKDYKDGESLVQKGYIVQHINGVTLRESTSGGAFTAIAKYILDQGGVVYGVCMDKDLYAHPSPAYHKYVDKIEGLSLFRNSKYIQSHVGQSTYSDIREFLHQGRKVCFSGTPCQVEGLVNYLSFFKNVDFENLILVDVVCRAVPSPLIFRKYIEYQEKNLPGKIEGIRFRDKYYGYKYSTLNLITKENKGNYHMGADSDLWLRAFFSNICDRPSCHECCFRKINRVSDFTIWDCFHVGRFSKKLDNDKGATRVLIHTEKGKKAFEIIKKELYYLECKPSDLINGAKELTESPPRHKSRDQFMSDAIKLQPEALFNKYFPYDFKTRLKHSIRMICYKIGIYAIAKKAYVRITKKY